MGRLRKELEEEEPCATYRICHFDETHAITHNANGELCLLLSMTLSTARPSKSEESYEEGEEGLPALSYDEELGSVSD